MYITTDAKGTHTATVGTSQAVETSFATTIATAAAAAASTTSTATVTAVVKYSVLSQSTTCSACAIQPHQLSELLANKLTRRLARPVELGEALGIALTAAIAPAAGAVVAITFARRPRFCFSQHSLQLSELLANKLARRLAPLELGEALGIAERLTAALTFVTNPGAPFRTLTIAALILVRLAAASAPRFPSWRLGALGQPCRIAIAELVVVALPSKWLNKEPIGAYLVHRPVTST